MAQRRQLVVLCVLLSAACTREKLHVEVLGCNEVLPGPVCEVPPGRTLRLLLAGAPGAIIDVRAAGQLLLRDTRGLGERLLRVQVPEGATWLQVEAPGGRAPPQRRVLAEAPRVAWLDEALKQQQAGQLERAMTILREGLAGTRAPGLRARGLGDLAKLERRRDQSEAAIGHLQEALRADREAGHVVQRASRAALLAFILTHHQARFAEARQVLAEHREASEQDPDLRTQALYFEGLIELEEGDLRSAQRRLLQAEAMAARTEFSSLLGTIRSMRAEVLLQLGQHRDALALYADLVRSSSGRPSCQRANEQLTLAWIQLRARDAQGLDAAEDPRKALAGAQAIYQTPSCKNPRAEVDILTTQAYAALQRAERRAAGAFLGQARQRQQDLREDPTVYRKLEWLDLEGRSALGEGRPGEALASFRELSASARQVSPPAQWRGAFGQAQALEALRRVPEALAAYERAEQLVDRRSTVVPMVEGWTTFLGQHEQATRRYLQLLIERGRTGDALALVRRVHRRRALSLQVMDGLDRLGEHDKAEVQRQIGKYGKILGELDELPDEDWIPLSTGAQARERRSQLLAALRAQLGRVLESLRIAPGEVSPLAPPPAGTVLLACHPLPAGWACFAQDDQGVEQAVVPSLSTGLLASFQDKLLRAQTLRILADAELNRIDFEAWPLPGRQLIDGLAVVRVLDRIRSPAPPVSRPRSLVLCSPEGNLPLASQACPDVARLLKETGQGPVELRIGDGSRGASTTGLWSMLGVAFAGMRRTPVTASTVREQVGRVDLFHFIGHAHFAGWMSALHLANKTELRAGDVLLLPRVPRRVVLLGCDTAGPGPEASAESGLAQAFLYRGSEAVVATSRPVEERAAVMMTQALYRHGFYGGDPVRAFRLAELELRQQGIDWTAIHLFVH